MSSMSQNIALSSMYLSFFGVFFSLPGSLRIKTVQRWLRSDQQCIQDWLQPPIRSKIRNMVSNQSTEICQSFHETCMRQYFQILNVLIKQVIFPIFSWWEKLFCLRCSILHSAINNTAVKPHCATDSNFYI